ncbi:MAG: hypothetical protein ACRCUT_14405, partial [Spirochaetota bacterium]
ACPDLFIVDRDVTGNDVVLIKNRVPGVKVTLADEVIRAGITAQRGIITDGPIEGRAVDEVTDVNLNMMSQNPVFLARIHLRTMDLSKVKQLLLDFDMSAPDAGFIHTFIVGMLKKTDSDETLKTQKVRLAELADDFGFYTAVISRSESEVEGLINSVSDARTISSYMTLIAKARSLFDNQEDVLLITEFENKLLEKKDSLQD